MKYRQIYSTNKNGARRSRRWLQTISNLLFPLRCQSCGLLIESIKNGLICESCFSKLVFLTKPQCPVCGLMFLKTGGDGHRCAGCRGKAPFFSKARSVMRYSKEVGTLIHKFKFGGDLSVLATFAKWAEKKFSQDGDRPDYIIPVPLHPDRIKERGFNQALLLAKIFFPTEKYKIKHILKRTENTTPQTKLDGEKRRKNLKNCFMVSSGIDVKGKVLYLVDDVYTTGTTVNECAKVLLQAGASRVEVFTLAMVVKENEI